MRPMHGAIPFFIPLSPNQRETTAQQTIPPAKSRRRKRRNKGADSSLHSDSDAAIPPPFRYARKGASLRSNRLRRKY